MSDGTYCPECTSRRQREDGEGKSISKKKNKLVGKIWNHEIIIITMIMIITVMRIIN